MTAMQSLKFNGDPSQWKLEAMAATREIFAAGVTMEHFVLQCVQQSFKGGNRDVQGQVTKDINDLKPGAPVNFEKLFSKYVRYLSTLQASRDSSVGGLRESHERPRGAKPKGGKDHKGKGDRGRGDGKGGKGNRSGRDGKSDSRKDRSKSNDPSDRAEDNPASARGRSHTRGRNTSSQHSDPRHGRCRCRNRR